MKRMTLAIVIVLFLFVGTALAVKAGSDHQSDWQEYIEKLCENKQIYPELVEALIERESGWNPNAVNGDCIGLMQIDSEIHKDLIGGRNLFDPYDNIEVGVELLEQLLHKYGEAAPALMFYNAGYSEKNGIVAYHEGMMSDYANWILNRAEELERIHGK